MGLADWLRILLLSLVWGSSFFYIEIALQSSGPLTIVLARVGLAASALMLYCKLRGTPIALDRRLLGSLCVLSLLGNVLPFSLITLGQTQIESGLAAILIAATPFFTVLLGHVWSRMEPATLPKVTGVLIGIAGVAVLMGADVGQGLSGSLAGQLAVLAAAFVYGFSALYARRFREMRPSLLSAWMLTFSTLILAPVAFLIERPFATFPEASGLAAIAALALLSTAFAYLLYFRVLASAGATNAMLVTFVQPLVAILLGVLFLHERFEPHHLAGMLLIFVGLALVDGRIVRYVVKRA